jgi:hypothetical protein
VKFAQAISRAKINVRQKVRDLGADRLLTLTKRDGIADLDKVWELWTAFELLVKRRFKGRSFRYVVVPELHANGTWHLHVAVVGFWNVITLRSLWHRVLTGGKHDVTLYGQDAPGNVDITNPARYRKRHTNLTAACANYIACYVGKGLSVAQLGRKTFASCKGIAPLDVRTLHLSFDVTHDELVTIVETYVTDVSGIPEWHLTDYKQDRCEGGYGEAGVTVGRDEWKWSRE